MIPSNNISIAWQHFNPNEVVCLSAEGNYTSIHLANGKMILVAVCLKELEKRIATNNPSYLRTHKSYLVNLQYFKGVNWDKGNPFLTLSNDYRAAISRRKRGKLRKQLRIISGSGVVDVG